MQYIKQKIKFNIKSRYIWLSGAIVILLLVTMFVMSSQNGAQSHSLSRSIVRFFRNILPISGELRNNPSFEAINFDLLLRKVAHFSEFFALSLFLNILLTKINFRRWKITRTVLSVSLFFAVLDELHQVFVIGRTPTVVDVLIDFAGAALAVAVLGHIRNLKKRKDTL